MNGRTRIKWYGKTSKVAYNNKRQEIAGSHDRPSLEMDNVKTNAAFFLLWFWILGVSVLVQVMFSQKEKKYHDSFSDWICYS